MGENRASDWDDLDRDVMIDERQEAYDIQLTRNWARKLMAEAEGTPYFRPCVDLILDLRAACHVARVPFQMPHVLEVFAGGWLRKKENSSIADKALRAVTFKIAENLVRGPVHFSAEQIEEIQSVCNGLMLKVSVAPSQSATDFRGQPWENLFQDHGFRLATWGSQRSAFVSAYNAYDHFLVQCLRIKVKNPTIRLPRGRKAGEQLAAAFDETIREECWDKREFRIAREVRNSLSHEGGKETNELRKDIVPCHEITTTNKDKMLQVMPEDTKQLLRLIEGAATTLISAIVV